MIAQAPSCRLMVLTGFRDPQLERAPWIAFFPGATISLVVFGLNLLGDMIRDLADPKLRGSGMSSQQVRASAE